MSTEPTIAGKFPTGPDCYKQERIPFRGEIRADNGREPTRAYTVSKRLLVARKAQGERLKAKNAAIRAAEGKSE